LSIKLKLSKRKLNTELFKDTKTIHLDVVLRPRCFSAGKPLEASPRRGIGLSAWGIIAVLAGGVFLCTGAYYAVLFYPILCKKERKYDIMELSSV
jgi:hypothetical protein